MQHTKRLVWDGSIAIVLCACGRWQALPPITEPGACTAFAPLRRLEMTLDDWRRLVMNGPPLHLPRKLRELWHQSSCGGPGPHGLEIVSGLDDGRQGILDISGALWINQREALHPDPESIVRHDSLKCRQIVKQQRSRKLRPVAV
jgi:hypothetical protein